MSANSEAKISPTDRTVVLRENFVPNGRAVPTGNGWTWIEAAWSIFRRAAGTWIGVTLALFLIYFVLFLLYLWSPFVGAVPIRTNPIAVEPASSRCTSPPYMSFT